MKLGVSMRCYLVRKGHIAAVEVVDGASDEAVIQQARTVFEDRKAEYEGFEVWDGARFVHRYPELPPRYVSAPIETRPPYHLYLLAEDGAMRGKFEFAADADETAYEIAGVVFDACSDRAAHFELRQGSRLINPIPPVPTTTLEEVIANRQTQIVELEETVRDSHWAVAKSERLLARLEGVKALAVRADPPETSAERRSVK